MSEYFDSLIKFSISGEEEEIDILLENLDLKRRGRYLPTIGVEFFVKDIEILNKKIRTSYFITNFDQRFNYVRPLYYKGSYRIFFIFDINNKNMLKEFEIELQLAENEIKDIPVVLIGFDMLKYRKKEAESCYPEEKRERDI